MTTCPHNKHGCRMMQHPDDQNRWYCPHCGKKLIEDPGSPMIIVIVGMIVTITTVFLWILPSNSSLQEPGQKPLPSQLPQSQSENSFVSPD